jgi:glycosyltransferase involved in cell wall biosynthesis
MNIVTVSEDCFPQIGGIATHVQGLSGALLRAGHSVHVITRRRDVPNFRNLHVRSRRFDYQGIPTTAIPLVYSPRNSLRRTQLRTRFALAAARRIVRDRAHVVTFHHYLDDPDIVRGLRRWRPLVFTNHSSQFLAALERGEHAALLRRIDCADAVIAPSRELVQATIACGYPEGATFYVPNGVDPSAFRPDPSARARVCAAYGLEASLPIVLCARRPVEKNGVIHFVHALERLARSGVRVSVLFAGTSPEPQPDEPAYTTELREAIHALPGGVHRRLLGGVPNESMPELQAAADVGVLPSLVEATSIAGLESMACGTPLVGTTVGGIPEIVRDGETGRLVPPADPAALAAALQELIADPARRSAMGAAARAIVEREFSWDVIARRSVEIYQRVLEARSRGRTLATTRRDSAAPAQSALAAPGTLVSP